MADIPAWVDASTIGRHMADDPDFAFAVLQSLEGEISDNDAWTSDVAANHSGSTADHRIAPILRMLADRLDLYGDTV